MLNFIIMADWILILVATFLSMVIGAIWYGVFSKPWMELNKFKKKDVDDQDYISYLVAFLEAFIIAFIMSSLVTFLPKVTFLTLLELAGWIWIGFIILPQLTVASFSKRPLLLAALDSGRLAISIILTVFIVSI